MTSYLIDDILELTKDLKSRAFYEKALRDLGEPVVAEEFGEMYIEYARTTPRFLPRFIPFKV